MAEGKFIAGTAVGAVAAALLLSRLGGGFGFGRGGGEGLLSGNEKDSGKQETAYSVSVNDAKPTSDITVEATAAPEEAPGDDGVLEITVREDKLYYESEAVDLTALRDALLRDYAEGVKVKLTDDHAIKSAYDEVSALLTSLGIEAE